MATTAGIGQNVLVGRPRFGPWIGGGLVVLARRAGLSLG